MPDTQAEGVVNRARQGDADALAELYQQFGRRVFGLCHHMLGSTEAAEDARSEVFLRVRQTIGSYDSSLPFSRWLLSVTSHYCVDVLRRRRLETRLFAPGEEAESLADPGVAGATRSPLSHVLADERRDSLRTTLAELPGSYRIPLALRYYAELSYDEIAAQLGLKRNHVATLIFRAKQELRRRLGPSPKGSQP